VWLKDVGRQRRDCGLPAVPCKNTPAELTGLSCLNRNFVQEGI